MRWSAVEVFGRGTTRVQELAERAGRSTGEFRVVNAAAPADAGARLADLARAGVTDVMIDVDYNDPNDPSGR